MFLATERFDQNCQIGDSHKLLKQIFECRHSLAHAKGGLINEDREGVSKSRSVLAEVVKQVGKKLLQGQNLMSGIVLPCALILPSSDCPSCALCVYATSSALGAAISK